MVKVSDRLNLFNIHPGLVDRTYTMNPKREELIGGGDLENGMTVLIAADIRRYSLLDLTQQDTGLVPNILISNRWCTVRKLMRRNNQVRFVGEYQDGSTHPRVYDLQDHWLVKKHSVELFDSLVNDIVSNKAKKALDEKREKIIELMNAALAEQRSDMRISGESDESDMAEVVSTTVDKIMELWS
jgi:hypothetical protein